MWRNLPKISRFCAWWLCISVCAAAGYRGQVTFGGLPVPGATVTASHGGQSLSAISGPLGTFSFPNLSDGVWTILVEMPGFSPVRRDITVAPDSPGTQPDVQWDLKMLPLDRITAVQQAQTPAPAPARPALRTRSQKTEPPHETSTEVKTTEADAAPAAADGFLINGSVNNGASSPFAQLQAFGNNRRSQNLLYTGGLGMMVDNSALDANSFSLTGQETPKPSYSRFTGLAWLGGPLQIPHLFRNGPNFFAAYQWTRNRNATTQPGLMPTLAERNGDLSQIAAPILDPTTGAPFPGNVIPQSQISPQAKALLARYPLPNFNAGARYNYQIPIVSPTHQDALQTRLNKTVNRNNQFYGGLALQSSRTDTPNLFGFLDTTDILGINTSANWRHSFTPRFYSNLGYRFSRFSTRADPYFENRENVSGEAGISGNNQDPRNWGPPSLVFSSGIASLSDAQASVTHNQTSAVSYESLWSHGGHNFLFGGDFRRQQFSLLSQQDPRGTFTFTGAATGSDLADFLLGIPDTSSIAFGNADKYFRESVYDIYFTDDWRVSPALTLNAGIRWEYGSPITELYDRLVNLDIAPGFSAVAPVVASNPSGPLTGERYPRSLIHPDKSGFEPRVGIAWRPLAASSLVIRAGYGVYYDTSVYQSIATRMAQQAPLSKSLSVQNSPADPLTLANGFNASASITPDTFAADPNFRVGYAQNWQLAVQRDLPGSLQMTATYLGIKGTRGTQEFLPNTFPAGAVNPCLACPAGFAYLTSNGNSTREAGEIQLRRRLHNGFTATLQYIFSKSIDDDAVLGGPGSITAQNAAPQTSAAQTSGAQNSFSTQTTEAPSGASQESLAIAQNWLNLSAERGLSSFDQRHLLSAQIQYTSGMGLAGGTLLSGWRGILFKEWTFATLITAGSGLPLTPIYLAAVQGTGVTGTIRPDYTGAPLYAAPPGSFLNPAAYVAPAPGQWGNAGRNSITGPAQFTLNASLGRTFRVSDRLNLDLRIDSTNALNHVTFVSWDTTVNSAQFGLPTSANAMRSLQTTVRLRF